MRRATLALAVVAACGKPSLSKEACNQRADAIEARVRAEHVELDDLQTLMTALDAIDRDAPAVPDAEEGSTDFAAGIPLPISAAKPDVLEAVAAAEACAAKPTKRPVRLYFVALPAEDAAVGESAAWLAKASTSWGVELQARRVVHLAHHRTLFPWPPHSEHAQGLAKDVFPRNGDPDVDRLYAEIADATRGCPAIKTIIESEDRDVLDFALPQGLRECGCTVDNLDELEGLWHLKSAGITDHGWIPPPDDATTRRSVSPLTCESARDPIIVGVYERWLTGTLDLRPSMLGLLDALTKCRDETKLDHSALVDLHFTSPQDASTSITISTRPDTTLAALRRCMAAAAHLEAPQPVRGRADVLVYLPAAN